MLCMCSQQSGACNAYEIWSGVARHLLCSYKMRKSRQIIDANTYASDANLHCNLNMYTTMATITQYKENEQVRSAMCRQKTTATK